MSIRWLGSHFLAGFWLAFGWLLAGYWLVENGRMARRFGSRIIDVHTP